MNDSQHFRKILVATDTRLPAHPIVLEAAELARHWNASLTIVDVVPEMPWLARLTLSDHQHIRDLMCEEKQLLLSELAASIRSNGMDISTKVLSGRTSVEIIREVISYGHDLVLRVAKGMQSRRKGFFGATGIHLLRKCPCPVWLVAPGATPRIKHVLGCLDVSSGNPVDDELNRKVFAIASAVSQRVDSELSFVQAWTLYGEQMLKGRLTPDDLAEVKLRIQDEVGSLFHGFLQQQPLKIPAGNRHLINGEPHEVIPALINEKGVDLVVMGTVARAGLSGLIIGNTAEQILDSIECSVLAVKPDSFASPIKLQD